MPYFRVQIDERKYEGYATDRQSAVNDAMQKDMYDEVPKLNSSIARTYWYNSPLVIGIEPIERVPNRHWHRVEEYSELGI